MDLNGRLRGSSFEQPLRAKSCPPGTEREPLLGGGSGGSKRRWSRDGYDSNDDDDVFQDKPLLHQPQEDGSSSGDQTKDLSSQSLIRNKKELLTMISLMLALFSALCSYAMVAPILPLEVSNFSVTLHDLSYKSFVSVWAFLT